MALYTVDMDVEKIQTSKDPAIYKDITQRKLSLRDKKRKITESLDNKTFNGEDQFKKNKDLRLIMK